jgi:hypothetical protein
VEEYSIQPQIIWNTCSATKYGAVVSTLPAFPSSPSPSTSPTHHGSPPSPSHPPPLRHHLSRQRRRGGARLRGGGGEGSGLCQGRADRAGGAVADPAPAPRRGEVYARALPRRRTRRCIQHHALPPRRRGQLHHLSRGLGPGRRRLRHHRQPQHGLELLLRFLALSIGDRR